MKKVALSTMTGYWTSLVVGLCVCVCVCFFLVHPLFFFSVLILLQFFLRAKLSLQAFFDGGIALALLFKYTTQGQLLHKKGWRAGSISLELL